MRKIIVIGLILLQSVVSLAQTDNSSTGNDSIKLNMTLEHAIDIAYSQSIIAFRQKNMYLASYWEFRSYKAERLPSLSLSSTPVNYAHSIEQRYDVNTNEDIFVPTERLISDASIDLTQNITPTGGQISASSSLQRIENFGTDGLSYYNTPITIGISQPLNGYNEYRWQAKIEPLKFEQAKREYLQSLQTISIQTTNYFFGLVSAEINLSIAETNLANADTLYNIGKGRFEIGTVTQDELLDLELSFLNAQMAVTQSQIALKQSRMELNSFLGLGNNVLIECEVPHEVPNFKVNVDEALSYALENNPQMLSNRQDLLEADQNLAQTRGQTGINANLYGNLGYNKDTEEFDQIYTSPYGNEQNLRFSISVPILDWGNRKGQIQMAKSNREVTEATVRQAQIDFEQDVLISVLEFNEQEKQVHIAAKADTIAQLGYDVTKQRFLIGNVDVINLNSAQSSLDAAKRNYIQTIQSYWQSYFEIRQITLFDFETEESLITELDDLLEK